MKRFRVLSAVAAVISIIAIFYGFANATENEEWHVLSFFGAIGFVSSTLIVLLSFFALEVDEDGAYVIDRKSPYGKVFLAINRKFKEKFDWQDSASFCQAFWYTNFAILCICVVIAALVLVCFGVVTAIIKFGLWQCVFVSFLLICCVVLTIYGLIVVDDYTYKMTHQKRIKKERRVIKKPIKARRKLTKNEKTLINSAVCTMFLLVLAKLVYEIGLATIWYFIKHGIFWIIVVVAIVSAAVSIVYLIFRACGAVSKSQFGTNFGLFYHQYLCPRIKIK